MEATKDQLIIAYNEQAGAVRSLQATVDMLPSTGSTYSGVIEDYHDVTGFIIATQPANVRVIGQAPVVFTNVFDMVSNGETFRIYIPSKNTFLVGSTNLGRPSKKPLENLRPQHVVEALFWPEFAADADITFEENDTDPYRYYVLTLLRETGPNKHVIVRKVWFDRADLRVSRIQVFDPDGNIDSDTQYSDWRLPDPPPPPAGAPPPAPSSAGSGSGPNTRYAHDIHIWRPHDDYHLEIRITKLELNGTISADRFELAQPAGTELVRLPQESSPGAQP
jgi:outer membrane lipoprotein-sorting protein